MKEYIVGIDIGSSKVCAAMGKVDRQGRLQIVGVASAKCYGVKKSTVVDIDSTSEGIRKCKQQLEAMTDVQIDEAYLNIPGGLCELEYTKGVVAVSSDNREIAYKDVERVLNTAKIISISSDKEIVGVIPGQYIVDGHENILDPVGMSGIRLEVDAKAVIAQSSVANNLMKSMEVAGLKTEALIIQPLALSSLILDQEERTMSFALADIGADTIDLCIFKAGNICYTNLIPLGGNTITNDIAKCLKISFSEAENLKTVYGDVCFSPEAGNDSIVVNSAYSSNLKIERNLLVEIIEARVEEFFSFIEGELRNTGYYNEISGIILSGGGVSLFKGINEFGRKVLGKPVRVIAPKDAGVKSPLYATPVGIVRRIFETTKPARMAQDYERYEHNRISDKNDNKSNTFVSKIKNLIEEIF